MKAFYFLVAFWALASSIASAYDPGPLQDFCVALKDGVNGVFVNGKFCKDPKNVTADDFFSNAFEKPINTSGPFGFSPILLTADNIPGLNTLGISVARLEFGTKGVNPLHSHPRASEILVVLEGTLFAGFVTSNQDNNRLFTKILNKGDVFVFPIGLIHFQFNVGYGNAIAIVGFSSQNPGVITIANSVFGSNPPISPEVLTKAFQVGKDVIDALEKPFTHA